MVQPDELVTMAPYVPQSLLKFGHRFWSLAQSKHQDVRQRTHGMHSLEPPACRSRGSACTD